MDELPISRVDTGMGTCLAGVAAGIVEEHQIAGLKRFTPETIHRLERLRWWDWPREKLQLLLPLLRRGDLTALERAAEKF